MIGGSGDSTKGAEAFIAQAERDGTDLSALWAVENAHEPFAEVALAVRSPGRTAVIFASTPQEREPKDALWRRASAIRAAAIDAGPRLGARLAQSLVEPHEEAQIRAFTTAGFMTLATLAYMRRDLRRFGLSTLSARQRSAALPAGLIAVGHAEVQAALGEAGARDLLRRALEASYEGTLDCPALCGLRTTDDVIDSHLCVGEFDPHLWWYVLEGEEPAGCLLFTPIPGNQTIELVYLGLAPRARGRGVADALLSHGLRALGTRRERTLACAVDKANSPALALYKRWNFSAFTARTALVRGL
ncbi:MAG: GNAT family N-acetyltransferase [Phycisphaerales bacterium]